MGMIKIYELVTNLGCHDEYFVDADEAADFARSELCTEEFRVYEREVPAEHFTDPMLQDPDLDEYVEQQQQDWAAQLDADLEDWS